MAGDSDILDDFYSPNGPSADWCSIPAEASSGSGASGAPVMGLAGMSTTAAERSLLAGSESAAAGTSAGSGTGLLGGAGGGPLVPITFLAMILLDKSGQIRYPFHPQVLPKDINPDTGQPFRDLREWGEYQQLSPGQIDGMVAYSAKHCRSQLNSTAGDRRSCTNASAGSASETCDVNTDSAAAAETEKAPPKAPVKKEEEKKRRFTVAVHAQGVDCGGKTSSTIGAPAITRPVPVTVAEGLDLSQATQALLTKSQLKAREKQIADAHEYITTGPEHGGRFGKKSFVNKKVRGGVRYDVDCHGDGPSFV